MWGPPKGPAKLSGIAEKTCHIVYHTRQQHLTPAAQAGEDLLLAADTAEPANHPAVCLNPCCGRCGHGLLFPCLLNPCFHLSTVECHELDKKISTWMTCWKPTCSIMDAATTPMNCPPTPFLYKTQEEGEGKEEIDVCNNLNGSPGHYGECTKQSQKVTYYRIPFT